MIAESKVMDLGRRKYGLYNWRGKTVSARVYVDAALRHLYQFIDGEDIDEESGQSHLAHARACMGILLDAAAVGNLVDDRPDKGPASRLIKEATNWRAAEYSRRIREGFDQLTTKTAFVPPDRMGLLHELAAEAAKVPGITNVDGEYEPAKVKGHFCGIPVVEVEPRTFYVNPQGEASTELARVATAEEPTTDVTRAEYLADLIEKGTTYPPGLHGAGVTPRAKAYIAGPMRGYEKFNFPAFDAARDTMTGLGYAVISPADIDRATGLDEDDTTIDVGAAEQAREFFERDAFALHSLRAENGDGIVLLPGWEASTGAAAELMIARWLGLKVFNEKGETYCYVNFDGDALERAVDGYLIKKAGEL